MCIKISAAALEEMFRPPINRFMKVLDRSFFHKTIPISAAKVNDKKQISKLRVDLKHDILHLDRLQVIRSIPGSEPGAGKALLLKPEIVAEGSILDFIYHRFSH